MKYKLYNIEGSETSTTFTLNKNVFGVTPNDHCIYLTIKSELASNRQGTNSTKTRAEVRGGGAKPWRQKGTGRSRVGSTRNPARVHGGVAFGPKPRKYKLKVNKKVKRLAKSSVLSQKLSEKKLIIVKNFDFSSNKTKDFLNILNCFDLSNKKTTILIEELNEGLILSSRNLRNIYLSKASKASACDLLDCDVLFLDKDSAEYYNKNLTN